MPSRLRSPGGFLRLTVAPLLAAALALSLAACGGGEESAADSGSAQDNAQDTARAKLERCMREQGVDVDALPGPGRRPGGDPPSHADRDKLREAIEGPCAKYREQAFEGSGIDSQELQDAMVKLRDCLRKEGIEVEAPSGGGGGMPFGGGVDLDDPDTQAAMEKCRGVLPEGFRRGPGGGPR